MKNEKRYLSQFKLAGFLGARVRKARISVPYLGMNDMGETTRNWAHMTIDRLEGTLCPRQIKKVIRKWVKQELGRKISDDELAMCMKRVEYCVG